MKSKLVIFTLLLAIGLASITAKRSFTADDLVGTWKYLISDVPPEYEAGTFVFELKDNKTVGYVESSEKHEMQNLTVDQGKVTFNTDSKAGVFKYSFIQKGDTLTGTIASQYGDFPIMAVRQAKK